MKVENVLGGFQTGYELVDGSKAGAIESFTVVYVRGTPRLLLPRSHPMMHKVIKTFLGGRLVTDLVSPCVQFSAWAGGPFSRLSSHLSLVSQTGGASPLRELVSDVTGRNDFQLALRLSFNRPNAKTVAMAITNAAEVLCYVKIGSEAMTNDLVAYEGEILEHFEGTGLPIVIPAKLYSGTWANGHNVLITAPLEHEPLKRDATIAHAGADALASQNMVTGNLTDSSYWRRTLKEVSAYENSDDLQETVADIERILGDREFDFGFSHGDWTRANLGIFNGQLAALDWERCTRDAPRGIDIAHFALNENTSGLFRKPIDFDQVAVKIHHYLKSAELPHENAEALILFAILEMVKRFKKAEYAGLRSTDSKFWPALKEGVQKWA